VGQHCVLIHTIVRKSLVNYCKRHPNGIPRQERVKLLIYFVSREKEINTRVLSAKSHNCGISSFLPNFTSVRGFDDRYLLSFVYVLPYVAVNTLFQQGYFYVGLRGAKWGCLP